MRAWLLAWLSGRLAVWRLWKYGPPPGRYTYRFTGVDERVREPAAALRERADNIKRDRAKVVARAEEPRSVVEFKRSR